MVTVCIPFVKDPINFAVLLATLQPQLHPDDDLYIIDTSKERLALKIAAIYGTTRCYVFVEPAPYEKSLQYGIQSMVENKQQGLIFLSEDCFISSTFIFNMKQLLKTSYEIGSPKVFENPYHKMDPNFKYYNPTKPVISTADNFSAHCFFINNDPTLGTKLNRRKKGYALLENEYVLVMKNE